MATQPIRVPEQVRREVVTAARVMDCTASELLQRAWEHYRSTPEFREDFALAQKAFAIGDLESVAERLAERGQERAARKAESVRRMRE